MRVITTLDADKTQHRFVSQVLCLEKGRRSGSGSKENLSQLVFNQAASRERR